MLTLKVHPGSESPIRSQEFLIVLRCSLPMVFAIYTDLERWCNRGSISDVRWTHGRPWEQGSRIRVEVREPLPTVVEQVLLLYEKNREVAYESHVFGMTFLTRLSFTDLGESETEIRVVVEMVGKSWRVFNFAVDAAIEKATVRFFEDLKRDCEWAARQTGQKAGPEEFSSDEADRSSQP